MNPELRHKASWLLAIVFVPTALYLSYHALRESRARLSSRGTSPSPAEAGADSMGVPAAATLPVGDSRPAATQRAALAAVREEQLRIAGQVPRRNPFSFSKPAESSALPAAVVVSGRTERIKLTGIVTSKDGKRMAVVNGKMLTSGSRMDKWTVVLIESDRVVLGDGTEKITLTLGQ